LYFTEFIAGSQLSWALQQHGLAGDLKITLKSSYVSFVQHTTKQMH